MGDGQSASAIEQPRAVSETEPAARGAQPMAIHRLRIGIEKNLRQDRSRPIDCGILHVGFQACDQRLELEIVAKLTTAGESRGSHASRTAVVEVGGSCGSKAAR